MKNILVQNGRSITSTIFLAVIVAGPVCAVGSVILQFTGGSLGGLMAAALHLV
jgi:hypothetical protein